jgi:hypothetical protein
MSGYLPHSSHFAISPRLESTPVFHRHSKLDPLVWPDATQESWDVAISGMGRGGMDYRLVPYLSYAQRHVTWKPLNVTSFIYLNYNRS